MLDEEVDTLLHRDRVDDGFALDATQPGFDDVPLGGVDHHRDGADVGLGGDQLAEPVHRCEAVDHALVHVDVDDLRTGLDLLPGDVEGGAVVALLDQFAEPRRAGDVGPLTDVDEQRFRCDVERFETGQPQRRFDGRRHPRCGVGHGGLDLGDVLGRGAAAAAEHVDQSVGGELTDDLGHLLRGLVVLTERVGQPGVRVAEGEAVRDAGQLGDVRPHVRRAQGTVEADGQWSGVPHAVPEGLGDLPGQGPPGRIGDRAGDEHRPATVPLLEEGLEREDRRLGVQRVEDRLDQEQVGATVDQACGLLQVRLHQFVEGDVARARVV